MRLSRRIKNINEKTERQVLNGEGLMLKEFLNKNGSYYNIDLNDSSNVKFVSKRYLNKKQSDKIKLFANKVYK